MLSDFLPDQGLNAVSAKAIELAVGSDDDDRRDAWQLAHVLLDVGFPREAAGILRTLVDASARDARDRKALAIDLALALVAGGDRAGLEQLEALATVDSADRSPLGAPSLSSYYQAICQPAIPEWLLAQPSQPEQLHAGLARWWDMSPRRVHQEEADDRRFAESGERMARRARAWRQHATADDLAKYQALRDQLKQTPKTASKSSTVGHKISISLSLTPQAATLLAELDQLLGKYGTEPVEPVGVGDESWVVEATQLQPVDGTQAAFAAALARVCAQPAVVEFVIFGGSRGYVQFTATKDSEPSLRGEAVSNEFLEGPLRLTDANIAMIEG